MQIHSRIIYPSLLVIFMGLHFSSNAIACGGPGSPPCAPDIPVAIPDAVTPSPSTFEIPEDLRKNLEDRLKSTNKQIEAIEKGKAEFCASASDKEQCKSFDTELTALQLEKEDILVGLGDKSAIHRMNLDNVWTELSKQGQKYSDTIIEVADGKAGSYFSNLDAVLEELRLRSLELFKRYDKLATESKKLGTRNRDYEFENVQIFIANCHEVLKMYSDKDPETSERGLNLVKWYALLYRGDRWF